jgi:hypothetical protein
MEEDVGDKLDHAARHMPRILSRGENNKQRMSRTARTAIKQKQTEKSNCARGTDKFILTARYSRRVDSIGLLFSSFLFVKNVANCLAAFCYCLSMLEAMELLYFSQGVCAPKLVKFFFRNNAFWIIGRSPRASKNLLLLVCLILSRLTISAFEKLQLLHLNSYTHV